MRRLTALIQRACLPLALLLLALAGCERYEFERAHVELGFSADTVSFDTVFTPIGSTTFACKVYNRTDRQLIIDEVRLALGAASPFSMNVDGLSGSSIRGIRLAKKDSLFIFLEVKKNKELLLTDQIVFRTGGQEQPSRIELVAYGQAVVLLDRDTTLRSGDSLTAATPYLVMGNITIDSGATVSVEAGAKLYFGKNCGMVVNGTLLINGMVSSPCLFSHPRHKDAWYDRASGQWQGITINAAGKVSATHAHLHGARQAFYLLDTLGERHNTPGAAPQLRLSRSKIEFAEVGISVCQGSVWADNCLVAHCRTNALLMQGGYCQAYHCTFAAYDVASGDYHGAQVALQNFRIRGKKDTLAAPLHLAIFSNSIIYGSNYNELNIKALNTEKMSCRFGFSAIKTAAMPDSAISVTRDNPMFADVVSNDFHLSKNTPSSVRQGRADVALNEYKIDLDGYNRTVEQDSSMGCYAYRQP